MNIDSIKNGIVIDHIKAGKSLEIYHLLNLDKVDCSVAIIKNVTSKKMGKKDIIKIEDYMKIDYTAISLLSPNLTINEVENGKIVKKIKPKLPEKVINILKCNNI